MNQTMKILLTFIMSVCIAAGVCAQTVTGTVVDSGRRPVRAVTVLAQTADSTFAGVAITDSTGHFSIDSVPQHYHLTLQHLLYETLTVTPGSYNAGTLVMKERSHELGEVVVKGSAPLVKVEDGGLSYNAATLAQQTTADNAYSMVLKTPGISEQDGAVTLAGAGQVTLFINGKVSTLDNDQITRILKSTPVKNVDRIQVMYNAPARFHVRGAVVNVVLRRKEAGTVSGEVFATAEQRTHTQGNAGVNLSITGRKTTLDLTYSLDGSNSVSWLDLNNRHTVDGVMHEVSQSTRNRSKGLSHNVRAALDRTLSDDLSLSAAYTGSFSPDYKSDASSEGNVYTSFNHKSSEMTMHNVNISLTSKKGFSAGADYTWYKDVDNQDFSSSAAAGGQRAAFTTEARQRIDRWKGFADMSHRLGGGWKLNYGASATFVTNDNTQVYNTTAGSDMSDKDTHSSVTEQTWNAYAGFDTRFGKKFSLSMTLTGEYYKIGDYSKWALLPAANLSYTASPSHIWQLMLSTDKSYPGYWEMQESTSYLNGYAEVLGNPGLKPSQNYRANLVYVLKGKYQLVGFYAYQDNYFVQQAYLSPHRLTMIYQSQNWNYDQRYGVSIILPFTIGKVANTRLILQTFGMRSRCDNFFDTSFNKSKWIKYADLNNNIFLTSRRNLTLEITARWISSMQQGIYDLGSIWGLDAALKYTFAKGRADLLLKGSDIFATWVPGVTASYNGQYMDMKVDSDNPSVNLTLRYRFKDYKSKKHTTVDTSRFGM